MAPIAAIGRRLSRSRCESIPGAARRVGGRRSRAGHALSAGRDCLGAQSASGVEGEPKEKVPAEVSGP